MKYDHDEMYQGYRIVDLDKFLNLPFQTTPTTIFVLKYDDKGQFLASNSKFSTVEEAKTYIDRITSTEEFNKKFNDFINEEGNDNGQETQE